MPIVGYNISSITAERSAARTGRIDINSRPTINSVTKRTMPDKRTVAVIGFEFLITYNPDIGRIRIVGEILYATQKLKVVLHTWEKEGKLVEEADVEIKNFLFRKCLTVGLILSENLQLPPPLMFPTLVPRKEDDRTGYIG
jgi:hypothetical protein